MVIWGSSQAFINDCKVEFEVPKQSYTKYREIPRVWAQTAWGQVRLIKEADTFTSLER